MKVKLKILNLFYLLFSTIAIGAYLLANNNAFLQPSFTYKINEELILNEGIDDSALGDLGITSEDLFSDLDTIVFEVKVNIKYGDLLNAWTEVGPEYNYRNSKFDAVGRYLTHYILEPALDNVDELLLDDLVGVAENAVKAMISSTVIEGMNSYSKEVVGYDDCFAAMEDNPVNTAGENKNKLQFIQTVNSLYNLMSVSLTESRFLNGYDIQDDHVEGFKESIKPYLDAIYQVQNEDEADTVERSLIRITSNVSTCFYAYGLYDDDGNYLSIYEAIGNIFQRLIDHSEYEDSAYNTSNVSSPFVDKLFAPLKGYIDDEDPEFDNALTSIFINVIAKTTTNQVNYGNAEGVSGPLFLLMLYAIRAFGILLVLFLLVWAIKIIQCIICFFRAKPYVRMNPLGILTGIIEAALTLISIATIIIYRNNIDVNSIRNNIPALKSVLPLGLSFELEFVFIPGILAIANLLFSIVYGPVKKKFKQESRDELLYSEEYNEYE